MKTIWTAWNGTEPILDIDEEGFALYRDRDPDAGWGPLRRSKMSKNDHIIQVELTPELKQTLLEDIAFTYGKDSKKFTAKMQEFNLL